MRGGSRVPLSYVVRSSNELHPKTSVDDLVTAYATHDEEIVKRATIIATRNNPGIEEDGPFNNSFVADRGKLWDLISPLIIKTEAWPHIKHARTSRDRRKAILAFNDQFMGPNNVDYIQK